MTRPTVRHRLPSPFIVGLAGICLLAVSCGGGGSTAVAREQEPTGSTFIVVADTIAPPEQPVVQDTSAAPTNSATTQDPVEALQEKTKEIEASNAELARLNNYCQALYDFSNGKVVDVASANEVYGAMVENSPAEIEAEVLVFTDNGREIAALVEENDGDVTAAYADMSAELKDFLASVAALEGNLEGGSGVAFEVLDSFRWFCQGEER